jgi:hypothetical protein
VEERAGSIHTIVEEDRPGSGSKYSDYLSDGRRRTLGYRPSETSLWSAATLGSVNSFFPRWSWETEKDKSWPDRYREKENVVYEVCIKCLEERRVVLQDGNPRTSARGSGIGARDSVLAMINNYIRTQSFGDPDVEEVGNEDSNNDPDTDIHAGVGTYPNPRPLGNDNFAPIPTPRAQLSRYPVQGAQANILVNNSLHEDPIRFENQLSTQNLAAVLSSTHL